MRKFRHYKGKEYFLIARAQHTESRDFLIVYQDKSGNVFARPESMFFDNVIVNGKEIPRFIEID